MVGIQWLPRDTGRPSVLAFIVVAGGLWLFGSRLKHRARYRDTASSETAHLIVNVIGPLFGLAGFGFALVALVVQTIQGR